MNLVILRVKFYVYRQRLYYNYIVNLVILRVKFYVYRQRLYKKYIVNLVIRRVKSRLNISLYIKRVLK